MRKFRLGSRRVPLRPQPVKPADPGPQGRCCFCGEVTRGLPAEGKQYLGLRLAELVRDGIFWVCSEDACLARFDEMWEADEEEVLAFFRGVAEDAEDEQVAPMSDPEPSVARDLRSFSHRMLRRSLSSLWEDGGFLYRLTREAGTRVLSAGVGAAVGAVVGAGVFAVAPLGARRGSPQAKTETQALREKVRVGQLIRELAPLVGNQGASMEYDARKKLEEVGYYPCSECGVAHRKEERHRMPPGTYWCEKQSRYVQPDDGAWTAEGYRQASGERWDLEDEDGGGAVH